MQTQIQRAGKGKCYWTAPKGRLRTVNLHWGYPHKSKQREISDDNGCANAQRSRVTRRLTLWALAEKCQQVNVNLCEGQSSFKNAPIWLGMREASRIRALGPPRCQINSRFSKVNEYPFHILLFSVNISSINNYFSHRGRVCCYGSTNELLSS